MADKFPQKGVNDVILTAHNELRTALSEGDVIPRLTETEILAIVNADNTKTLIVFNTTTDQFEGWKGTERRIFG